MRKYVKKITREAAIKKRMKSLSSQEENLRKELSVTKLTSKWMSLVSEINSISADKYQLRKQLETLNTQEFIPDSIQIVPLNK